MNELLKAMMDQRLINIETYKEQADFIETIQDTLNITGQLTEDTKQVINGQWDKINDQFMERSLQGRVLQVAI